MTTRIVYCSFDRFPSPKGAATHIDAFVKALGFEFGSVDLVTLPSGFDREDQTGPLPDWNAKGVTHFQLDAEGSNLIERVTRFRRNLDRWWTNRFSDKRPDVVHVRSIFEGYPIAQNKTACCDFLVYEVNGLPSIELKYHYPKVADDSELLTKIRHQEDFVIRNADRLITVSEVNKRHLISRGAGPEKISVIPNGVDLDLFPFCRRSSSTFQSAQDCLTTIYTGTMSSWQGVIHAVEAISLFRRDACGSLSLVGPYRKKEADSVYRRIDSLDLRSEVFLREAVSKHELCQLYHQTHAMIAPLTRCDRNTVQGCCPLKILEGMAAGIPVVASRLPVVEELIEHDVDGLLVRPNSPKSIKDALFRLRNEDTLAQKLALAARKKIEAQFSWNHSVEKLIQLYRSFV